MALDILSIESLQQLVGDYGYWSVFFGIGLENMGLPLPGEAVTLLGGFLAGSGDLSYGWVLFAAIAGSFLGNNIGYFVGKWGGLPLIHNIAHLFRIEDEKIESAREKFLENAPKAVFFGRFVTFFRIFAAPLAGLVEMPFPLFTACNLAGAIVWATVMVTLSFVLGKVLPLEEVVEIVAKFGLGILGLVVIWIAVSIWLNRRTTQDQQIS